MRDDDSCFSNSSVTSESGLSIHVPPIDGGEIHFDPASNEQCKERVMLNDGSSNPLYPGASITQFQAISIMISWFTLHPGISKSAFDRLLYLLHTHILPAGNTLPQTYKEARKSLQNLLTPTKAYHCCVNDCIIFRDSETKKYADLDHCPECNEHRFMEGSSSIPRKRFIHLPLKTKIRRLFSHKSTAQLFQRHLNDEEDSDTTDQTMAISTIHDTSTWKEWYGHHGIHNGDKRALSLGFCTDGINPIAKEKVSYSMWPIVLFPLNFPAHIRKLSSSMMMVGIIPGPKEVKCIDPYLEIVADDIASLNGMKVYDACDDCEFELKASLLLHVLDYPGQGKVFHSQGQFDKILIKAHHLLVHLMVLV